MEEVFVSDRADCAQVVVVDDLDGAATEKTFRADRLGDDVLSKPTGRIRLPSLDQFFKITLENHELFVCLRKMGALQDIRVIMAFKEVLEAPDRVGEVGDNADEMAGSEAVWVVDDLLEMTEVELLERFDAIF
jgi:hypothetical protein